METLSPRLEQPNHEVDQRAPFSATVMDTWSYTSTSPHTIHGMVPHYTQG